jgi:hypothetical protein
LKKVCRAGAKPNDRLQCRHFKDSSFMALSPTR